MDGQEIISGNQKPANIQIQKSIKLWDKNICCQRRVEILNNQSRTHLGRNISSPRIKYWSKCSSETKKKDKQGNKNTKDPDERRNMHSDVRT